LSYLIFSEIAPNAFAPLLAEFGLRFCFVFLTIASLSFLGIGIQPPLADWGTMVRDLSQFIAYAPFWDGWPGYLARWQEFKNDWLAFTLDL
ncbi:MAG: ABC transporter permease subunit, partial [Pseudomonadota bacterium]|nr:ABC transporter permease subunit [Pseudomonadota bacterium]